jgi:hypothetical protein
MYSVGGHLPGKQKLLKSLLDRTQDACQFTMLFSDAG